MQMCMILSSSAAAWLFSPPSQNTPKNSFYHPKVIVKHPNIKTFISIQSTFTSKLYSDESTSVSVSFLASFVFSITSYSQTGNDRSQLTGFPPADLKTDSGWQLKTKMKQKKLQNI